MQREISLLSTSATVGPTNVAGPPNEQWLLIIYWNGLHVDIRRALMPERAKFTSMQDLRNRAHQVCPPDDVSTSTAARGFTTSPSRAQSFRPGQLRPFCTHPAHKTQHNIQHTWADCTLNEASRNFDAGKARKAALEGHIYSGDDAPLRPPTPHPMSTPPVGVGFVALSRGLSAVGAASDGNDEYVDRTGRSWPDMPAYCEWLEGHVVPSGIWD